MTSAHRAKPPFRADHVGSLLRPPALAAAREQWRRGELAARALRQIEDEAIREAVGMQESVGLKGITDGEFRRDFWHLDYMWGFDGAEPSETAYASPFSGGAEFVAPAAKITAKIAYPAAGIMREDFAFLQSVTGETAKLSIPAPTMFRHRLGREIIGEDVYPDMDEFWADLGRAYNGAVRDLASIGCRYLQLDDVNTCLLCSEEMRERIRQQGDDPERLLERYIEANNAAVTGRPADLVVTIHMCRGNFQSQWIAEGGYEAVAEKFLAETAVDGFFMEFDSERAGGFEPLRFLPKDKLVVLGIVTSKTPELEAKDDSKRRIDVATRHVSLEQLCLSPQCGFSSTHHGNALSHDEQRRKLAHVVEVAEEVWGSA